MQLELILEATKKFGTIGTIVACSLFVLWRISKTAWFVDLFARFVDWLIQRVLKKEINTKSDFSQIDKSVILNHDIFESINFWVYSKLPTFEFSTEYRTIIFRKYLKIYLMKHKAILKAYVDNPAFESMDESQFWESLLQLLNKIIREYEEEMLNAGIPLAIVNKMKVKNNDTLSLTMDLIEGICKSKFHDSKGNLLKLYSVLNIIYSILEKTILDSVRVCNSINGELSGLSIIENGRLYVEPPSIH